MDVHRIARIAVAACLAAVLVIATAGPALAAAPAPGAPRALGAFPRAAARAGGSLRTAALPPGWSQMDLPPGSQLKGWVPGNGGKIVWVPMYAGMTLNVQFKGANPQDWVIALWNSFLDPEDPLTYDVGASPLGMTYTAGQVTGDYGEGVKTYDWGWYPLYIYPPDSGGTFTLTWSVSDPPVTTPVQRVSGVDRYATSVETAQWGFGENATDTVVIATGRDFPDALASSALCGSWGAPLLLTAPTTLPGPLSSALQTFGVKRVFIIGGPTTISTGLEQTIDALPGVETSRVAGNDRYGTSVAIANKVREHEIAMGRLPKTEAFLASGKSFPDALAVSPYAYSQRIPILLSRDTYIPVPTTNAFTSLGIDTVHVVGGTGSISEGAYASIPSSITKDREIAGSDRTHTSSLAALYAIGQGWATWSHVGLATGYNFPDALGGGVAAGEKNGVLLLTKHLYLSAYPGDALYDNRAGVTDAAVFGGTGTVNGCVIGDVNDILKTP